MLFAVIMITLTAMGQTKITRIKVIALVETDQYDRTTETTMDGRMGIDLDNQMIYSYYDDGSTVAFDFIVDRKYTCKDNYYNLEGRAKNVASGKTVLMNIATHKQENLIIVTLSDGKLSMSFIGRFY